MRSSFHFAVQLYLALAVLAGVPAGASRSVLCIAPNGHVAFEMGEGRCADYAPFAGGTLENAGVCTAPDGCGDCVDVPVGKQVWSSARHGTSVASLRAPQATPAVVAVSDAELFAFSSPSAVARGTPTRPSFPPTRTTILRN